MQRNIPIINENFDLQIFLQIARKSIWFCVLIMIFAFIGAFLYLRYTPPLYQSSSILQINEENQTKKILQIADYDQYDLSNKLELLRSKEFLKRTFNKLPLSVKYYNQGTFLSTEMYRSAPFKVDVKVNNSALYEIPVYIDFKSDSTYKIQYRYKQRFFEGDFQCGKWAALEGIDVKVEVLDYLPIKENSELLKPIEMFFVVKNPQTLLEENLKNLTIEILNASAKTILITFKNHNAQKTAEVVNTIAEEYIKYDIEKKRESSQNILNFIEEQLRIVYSNLDKTERNLHDFRKENRINENVKAIEPFPIFTTKINEFQNEIMNIEFELVTLKRISDLLDKDQNINIYEFIALLSGTKSESILVSILNNIQSILNQREQLLSDVTSNNLKIKTVEKQLENQKKLLKEFLGATISRLSSQKDDYKHKIEEYEKNLFTESTFKEVEYSKLQRLYTINEGFYHKLIEKKAEYMISQAGFVSQNEILEKSTSSNIPISPKPNQIYVVAFMISLLVCVMIIIVRYLFYDVITSISNIQPYTDVPVIGLVPKYKRKIPVSQLLVNLKPNSMFSESFRAIRSNLEFISNQPGTKIIAVSSTISGEGKTFIAINLAGILALTGKKVLLLDSDLRKPRVHLGFDTENKIGVSTILIGNNTLAECIHPSGLKNFDFVTSGTIPPNPNELILGEEMTKLLEQAKSMYDIIIIDTPPIGIVTDALTHFQAADYPLYVMKADVSKRSFIQNINNLAKTKNLHHLSIILNCIDFQGSKYGYGYKSRGYGYGYGHGYYGYGYYDEEKYKPLPWYKRIFGQGLKNHND